MNALISELLDEANVTGDSYNKICKAVDYLENLAYDHGYEDGREDGSDEWRRWEL